MFLVENRKILCYTRRHRDVSGGNTNEIKRGENLYGKFLDCLECSSAVFHLLCIWLWDSENGNCGQTVFYPFESDDF